MPSSVFTPPDRTRQNTRVESGRVGQSELGISEYHKSCRVPMQLSCRQLVVMQTRAAFLSPTRSNRRAQVLSHALISTDTSVTILALQLASR